MERLGSGSSPRLRGTFELDAVLQVLERFIPAPAGNMLDLFGCVEAFTVHPRACGEHCTCSPRTDLFYGSSPRLRGTYRAIDVREQRERFIPAPAGNILPIQRTQTKTTVHPRACGEHEPSGLSVGHGSGSSPRLRGTCRLTDCAAHRYRFIPAPAGNIVCTSGSAKSVPVHPRACGEHTAVNIINRLPSGSSPRLRGTYVKQETGQRDTRFIPAPAGNIS